MPQKDIPSFSQLGPSRVHRLVQYAFLLFFIYAGVRFYFYAMWALGETQSFVSRPASVEAFLPIGALMSFKRLILTGRFDPVHPAGLTIFLMAMITALLFRKGFCGHLCPVGALSGLLHRLGRLLGIVRPLPRWAALVLTVPKYLLLAFFVKIVLLDMSVPALEAFSRTGYYRVADTKMLLFFLSASPTLLLILGALALGSLLVPGFWCRGFCPYGALLGIVALFSPTAVRRDPETCISCGRCDRACPSGIRVQTKKCVSGPECVGCGECLGACPVPNCLSLRLGWGRAARKAPWGLWAAGCLCTVFLLYFWAAASGHWNNNVPPDVVRAEHREIRSLQHP